MMQVGSFARYQAKSLSHISCFIMSVFQLAITVKSLMDIDWRETRVGIRKNVWGLFAEVQRMDVDWSEGSVDFRKG